MRLAESGSGWFVALPGVLLALIGLADRPRAREPNR